MRRIWIPVTALTVGLAAGNALHGQFNLNLQPVNEAHAKPPTPTTKHFDPRQGFAPLVEALKPAVVSVEVTQRIDLTQRIPEGVQPWFHMFFGDSLGEDAPYFEIPGQGSGFVISADGYILTNHHVVDGAEEVTVRFEDDRSLSATVVVSDKARDVALLKIEDGDSLPYVELGSSEALRAGDWVLAIGNPLGLTHTVTAGIVSAKGRFLNEGGRSFGRSYEAQTYVDFIQTDASINQGNSGGPLFNLEGEVVGINTAVSRAGQGIGFAVPIDMVKSIIEDLKGTGTVTRGWLGISLQALDGELARALGVGVSQGAVVREVGANTPAAKGGLKPGDVITKIDKDSVETHDDVIRRIGLHRAGDKVSLTVERDGKNRTLHITLGARPSADALARGLNASPETASKQAPASTRVEGLLLETQRGLGNESAVIVQDVSRESAAAGRLQVGDRILEVNRNPVHTKKQAEQLLERSRNVALLLVEREGARIFVALPVE